MEKIPDLSSQATAVKIPPKQSISPWGIRPQPNAYVSTDASLFSTSLPVLPHEKFYFELLEDGVESAGPNPILKKVYEDGDVKEFADDVDDLTLGNFLPDEEELLAGMIDDMDLSALPSNVDDVDDYDLFGSGGMELEFDLQDSLGLGYVKAGLVDGYTNGSAQYGFANGVGAIAGEHPYGEHPSRTLFVRNINSNVEDSELRVLFEQYGAIRTLYTACKHRGFVMISYYDIRAARTAMRALQNKPLRRRKLDIHFSIPKDNPSDKDLNQGTLVVFNLDPSVSNDDLRQIFGAYGEIKEIRETPHKRHHKFIEFYDVRAAEAALKSLNRSDIAGKRIKLEPSRPGGARRSLMQQLNQETDPDETRSYRPQVGSPIASPPGSWAQLMGGESNSFHPLSHSPGLGTVSPVPSNHLPGLASILPPLSSSVKIAPIGKDQGRVGHAEQAFSNNSSHLVSGFQHPHSFPEHSGGVMGQSPASLGSFGPSTSSTSGIETLTGPQFLWGSPTPYSENTSSAWTAAPLSGVSRKSFTSNTQGYSHSNRQSPFMSSSHHHVGSAPSGVPFERHFGFFQDSPDTSYMTHVAFGGMGLSRNDGAYIMNMSSRAAGISPGVGVSANMVSENGSSSYRMIPQRLGHMPLGGHFPSPFAGMDGLVDRSRSRRVESSVTVNQLDNKKQYQLDLQKIISGEDTKTTLMIKNIPNKYTSKMLLAAIDENHKGTYDFLYLPIDFKNKCNVGYAFINMVSPSHIISFYEAFNGKKWEKFNSEKVASLAYARIQGRAALVTHFANSSVMNEDKRCRPILFNSDGPENGDLDLFPSNSSNMYIRPLDSTSADDSPESPTKPEMEERNFIG